MSSTGVEIQTAFLYIQVDKNIDFLAGNNPFFLKGDEWKTARNRIAPTMTLAKLKGYLPNIIKVGDEMVKYLKDNVRITPEMETREV